MALLPQVSEFHPLSPYSLEYLNGRVTSVEEGVKMIWMCCIQKISLHLSTLKSRGFSPSLHSKIQRILSGSSSLHSLKSRGFSPSLSLVPQISHAGDKAGARSHWSDPLSRDWVLCSMIRGRIIKTSWALAEASIFSLARGVRLGHSSLRFRLSIESFQMQPLEIETSQETDLSSYSCGFHSLPNWHSLPCFRDQM